MFKFLYLVFNTLALCQELIASKEMKCWPEQDRQPWGLKEIHPYPSYCSTLILHIVKGDFPFPGPVSHLITVSFPTVWFQFLCNRLLQNLVTENNKYYLTVSEGQETWGGSAAWLGLGSPQVTTKLLIRMEVIWCLSQFRRNCFQPHICGCLQEVSVLLYVYLSMDITLSST